MSKEELIVDQREYSRKPCFFMAVDYVTNNNVYTEPVQDISKDGLFIETESYIPIGENVNMVFTDYDNLRLIKISGNVIRTMSNGIAIKFCYSNQNQKSMINSFVKSIWFYNILIK